MSCLPNVIEHLRALGLKGVAIIDQGGYHYLAMAVNKDGKVCDPRSWDTHDTPEAALTDLYDQLPREFVGDGE